MTLLRDRPLALECARLAAAARAAAELARLSGRAADYERAASLFYDAHELSGDEAYLENAADCETFLAVIEALQFRTAAQRAQEQAAWDRRNERAAWCERHSLSAEARALDAEQVAALATDAQF